MLKTLLILILAYCLIITQSKPIPDLCFGFSGVFIRNITELSADNCHSSRRTVEFNPKNQSAYVSITSLENDETEEGLYWFIQSPPGAPSNFFGDNTFVLFQLVNETSDESYCSYSTYFFFAPETLSPDTFPSEWYNKETENYELRSWYSFPESMEYSGRSSYRGIPVDLWEDTHFCTIFGVYTSPCFTLATLVDQDVPVFVEHVHQKRPHSFEEDWIQRDEWESFIPTTPTIDPPTNWQTTCYNTDNGYNINPTRSYVATPSGMDSFSVSLTAPPPSGTTVQTIFVPTSGCTYCAEFVTADGSPTPELEFTEFNWDTPQTVYIRYLEDGEVEYSLFSSGGGYDLRNWETGVPLEGTMSETLRILTCEDGVPGFGC